MYEIAMIWKTQLTNYQTPIKNIKSVISTDDNTAIAYDQWKTNISYKNVKRRYTFT
jgi:hypothetical protein